MITALTVLGAITAGYFLQAVPESVCNALDSFVLEHLRNTFGRRQQLSVVDPDSPPEVAAELHSGAERSAARYRFGCDDYRLLSTLCPVHVPFCYHY